MIAHYVLLGAALFSIGAYGVIARRNLLVVLMSLELMLNGANVTLVAFALQHHASGAPHGQVFVLVAMAVAAAEVAVGLAIVISLFRTKQTVDTHQLRALSG
jgi:NADH-quinone oxidoreductase subunit K